MIRQVTIIGLGLIGGAIARAIKRSGFCNKTIGYDVQTSTSKQAFDHKIVDGYRENLIDAIKDAELIIIATPFESLRQIFSEIQTNVSQESVITDVCSIKVPVIKLAKKILDKQFKNFVPAHPIAGAEKSGFMNAPADLFKNRCVVLTPVTETRANATKLVKQFWQRLGAEVTILDPKVHDNFLAITSHLPQLLAYTFMNYFIQKADYSEILPFIGMGFKDTTRIAASNPNWWSDIFLVNKDIILSEIKSFKRRLGQIEKLIQNGDRNKLQQLFSEAKTVREKL
jgi:prephenate dehydrogenase